MENPYDRAPFEAVLWHVPLGAPVRSYLFLGSAPKAVLRAAQSGKKTQKDADVLRRYYGQSWKRILNPRSKKSPTSRSGKVEGGKPDDPNTTIDFGDLEDFDNIDTLINEQEEEPELALSYGREQYGREQYEQAPAWNLAPEYSGISIYPADTFAELKNKIYAATSIPPYRQVESFSTLVSAYRPRSGFSAVMPMPRLWYFSSARFAPT